MADFKMAVMCELSQVILTLSLCPFRKMSGAYGWGNGFSRDILRSGYFPLVSVKDRINLQLYYITQCFSVFWDPTSPFSVLIKDD